MLRRDGIQDNNSLKRGGLSFCIRAAVPNVCYEHLCACVMVAVAAVGVADAICAQQLLLLLYPTRLGYARSEIRPRATAVLVRCFVLPDCPTPRRELCWHQCCWLPIFGRCLCSGRRVLIGVVQTVLWRAMPTAWPGRVHLLERERYSRCRDRSHLEMQQNQ